MGSGVSSTTSDCLVLRVIVELARRCVTAVCAGNRTCHPITRFHLAIKSNREESNRRPLLNSFPQAKRSNSLGVPLIALGYEY